LAIVDIEEEGEQERLLLQPIPESISIEQAMRDNPLEWKASLRSELQSLMDIGTFKVIKGKPSSGINLISCKIVLRDKLRTDGTIRRYKSRMVIKGFEQ
jgi:hypothetical protein